MEARLFVAAPDVGLHLVRERGYRDLDVLVQVARIDAVGPAHYPHCEAAPSLSVEPVGPVAPMPVGPVGPVVPVEPVLP